MNIDGFIRILPSSFQKSTKHKRSKILRRSPKERRHYCLFDLELKEKKLQVKIAKFKEQREIYLLDKQEFQNRKEKLAERYSHAFGIPAYLLQLSDNLSKRESNAIQKISEPIDQVDEDILFIQSQENAANHFEMRLNDKIYDLSNLENKLYNESFELQEIISHNIIKSQENEYIKLKIKKLVQKDNKADKESSSLLSSFDNSDKVSISNLPPPNINNDSIRVRQQKINECEKEILELQNRNEQIKIKTEEILNQKLEKCRNLQNEIQETEQYQKMINDKEFEISVLNDEYQKVHSKFTLTNSIRQRNQTTMVELDQRREMIDKKSAILKEKQEILNELQESINECEKANEILYQNYKEAIKKIHLLQKQVDIKLDTIVLLSADMHEVPTSPFSKTCSNVAELQRKLSNFEKDTPSSEPCECGLNPSL